MRTDPLAPLDRPKAGADYITEKRHPINEAEMLHFRYMTSSVTPGERQAKIKDLANALGMPEAEIEALIPEVDQP